MDRKLYNRFIILVMFAFILNEFAVDRDTWPQSWEFSTIIDMFCIPVFIFDMTLNGILHCYAIRFLPLRWYGYLALCCLYLCTWGYRGQPSRCP